MTTAVATPASLSEQQLGLIMQYTVEAYKTFEKLAESLPNPMAAMMFKQFAVDERGNRDLMEMKIAASPKAKVHVTLGADMTFQDILEGSLSYRETTEFLIMRERAMERKLNEFIRTAALADKNLLIFLMAEKRAHVVELERELELLKLDADWWRREDAESRIVHGIGKE
ncbi:MAG TPA: hypothetical protein VLU46_01410 [Thermoanaerobaculia bacterium]|nr:hypothetical protein [Thermoanaerobaculia bacterium]